MAKPGVSRRTLALAGPALFLSGTALARVAPTPDTTEGPFYPKGEPTDNNADLVQVDGIGRLALGDILHLNGRVLDHQGEPLPDARVEIWQCDANGVYLHPGDRHFVYRDPAFQGFGHVITGAAGRYSFRTIVPVPYTGRTPHIHVKVFHGGGKSLTTQLYLKGNRRNANDYLFRSLSPDAQRRLEMNLTRRGDFSGKVFETSIDLVISE